MAGDARSSDCAMARAFRDFASMGALARCRFGAVVAVVLALSVGGCGRLLAPELATGFDALREGEYRLDPTHSVVLFKAGHLGLSKYIGRFDGLDATLSFDPEAPERATLDAVVELASLDVADDGLEERLLGPGWLDASSHPQARFRSRRVEFLGDDRASFLGDLTLAGVTRPLTFEARYNGGARNPLTTRYTIGFEARAILKRSDFGIDAWIPAVADEVELEIHAEFQRR